MKSNLEFYQSENNTPSECGDVLDIQLSSEGLDWNGVVLEKGSSPHFYPSNVYTPYFYFALGLEQELSWSAKLAQGMTALKTAPGEIWINPPKQSFSHEIHEPCFFIILAVEEQRFLQSCPLNLSGKKLQFLKNYNVQDDTIKGILDLFVLEVEAGGRNGEVYINNLLSLLSNHYVQNYSNFTDLQNEQLHSSKFNEHQLRKVDEFIKNHIGNQISVEDMADLLNCSKFYFLREFKKMVGITPYQYLMNQRLDQAKSLLLVSGADIASVSHDLGFNDQSHFTRSFKKQFGKTPGQYQKSHKNLS